MTEFTKNIIFSIEKKPIVKKISLGIIRHTGTKNFKIKIKNIKTALELNITGSGSVQTIYVYSENINFLEEELIDEFKVFI